MTSTLRTEITEDLDRRAAERVADAIRAAVAARGRCTLAVSGGRTPWSMFRILATLPVPWGDVSLFQVDERAAPDREARNWTGITRTLLDAVDLPLNRLFAMPVEHDDRLAVGAKIYGAFLVEHTGGEPPELDVVTLGLGDDGHTASLVPGDPVLDATDWVGVTGEYRGHRRMTLTYPVLARARSILWLVSGAGKAAMVRRLVDGDPSIPAGRVPHERATLVLDPAAAAELD